jgi:hypothetical protein
MFIIVFIFLSPFKSFGCAILRGRPQYCTARAKREILGNTPRSETRCRFVRQNVTGEGGI